MLQATLTRLFLACVAPPIASLRLQNPPEAASIKIDPIHSRSISIGNKFETFLKSKKAKVIFFAGVEGSGHHLLEAMMPHINYTQTGFESSSWTCGGEWKETGIQDFTRHLESLNPNVLYVLPQQYSYPMCMVGGHVGRMTYDCPRVDWMQEAAHAAGVDLHVIQLHRDLGDCLSADCTHRNFEPCAEQADTLLAMGSKMKDQLIQLQPEERSCFRYGNDEEMAREIVTVFGDGYEDLASSIYKNRQHGNKRDSVPNWQDLESKLQGLQEDLETICSGSSQITLSMLARQLESDNQQE